MPRHHLNIPEAAAIMAGDSGEKDLADQVIATFSILYFEEVNTFLYSSLVFINYL